MRRRIYFDMDGTLSKWENTSIEIVARPGFFISRSPVSTVIGALKLLLDEPSYDIFILSSVYPNGYAEAEKREWNRKHTGIPEEKQIYVSYGTPKAQALSDFGGVKSNDILIDDFSFNLKEWPGIGIKLYNGINGTKGSWQGFCIHSNMNSGSMATQIKAIIDNT